jgi:NTE family protein
MISLLKFFRKKKVGLVLGSGGSKGIAHIAVIEYLEALDVPISMISGSSIGALIAAVYASGSIKLLKEDVLKMDRKQVRSYFDPVFPLSGLMEGKKLKVFLSKYIPSNARIEDLPIPIAVVATDLFSGEAVVLRSGSVIDAVRASISIPGVFIPVKYGDSVLVDGGVANPLPIDIVQAMGADLTIAVNLHPKIQSERLKKTIKKRTTSELDPDSLAVASGASPEAKEAGISVIKSAEKWLGRDRNKKDEGLPNILEVISQSIDIMGYVNTTMMLKYARPTVLIEPDLVDMPTLDFARASRALTEGHSASWKMKRALIRRIKRRI